MATQLDRIENMLKVILEATTNIELANSFEKAKDLRNEVAKYDKGAIK